MLAKQRRDGAGSHRFHHTGGGGVAQANLHALGYFSDFDARLTCRWRKRLTVRWPG